MSPMLKKNVVFEFLDPRRRLHIQYIEKKKNEILKLVIQDPHTLVGELVTY